MRSFRDLPSGTLKWAQRHGRSYELRYGEEPFAILEWQSVFGSLATGQCSEGAFTFKRGGFLEPRVTVRRPSSDTDFAILRMSLGGGGILSFPDGRRYDFHRHGFWSPEWSFSDVKGQRQCRFAMTAEFLRREAELTLEVDPRSSPDLPLLALLGWYVILLQLDEAAAAVAAAAAIS